MYITAIKMPDTNTFQTSVLYVWNEWANKYFKINIQPSLKNGIQVYGTLTALRLKCLVIVISINLISNLV